MSDPRPPGTYLIGGTRLEAAPLAAGLYLTATPIGNLADISLRALATLAACDAVYCEDTRVTAKLLNRYGIHARLKSYHDYNAARVRPEILDRIAAGAAVALVSDAGTPLVSDPGYKLVRDCIAAGLPVDVVPGPNAALAALSLSGLASDRFLFCGFLPPRQAARRRRLAELAAVDATLILYETAPRVAETLADIGAALGARQVALAREITKLHQEVLRGTPDEVAATVAARGGVKGEIALVVGPPGPAGPPEAAEIDARLATLLDTMPAAKAAARLARETGLPKAHLYDRAVALRAPGSDR